MFAGRTIDAAVGLPLDSTWDSEFWKQMRRAIVPRGLHKSLGIHGVDTRKHERLSVGKSPKS